jgi:hypothetical protein
MFIDITESVAQPTLLALVSGSQVPKPCTLNSKP